MFLPQFAGIKYTGIIREIFPGDKEAINPLIEEATVTGHFYINGRCADINCCRYRQPDILETVNG
jgi:hypothetical protein